MKIFKTILLIIAVLIAIPLIAALFIKKEYAVKREIIINQPVPAVFNYVKLVKNQDHYSKWVMMDPAMKKDFRGTDGTVGFVYAWDGNGDAGKGEQEIRHLTEGKEIDMEVRFVKPFESTAFTHLQTESVSASQTKVTWGMQGSNSYPLNFMNLFMDKLLGKDLGTSLINLKAILEKP